MFLSLIIPAYNESKRIGQTIEAARNALHGAAIEQYEIVVSDDHSTDNTRAVAEAAGARVISSGKRNIGATRNVGAAAAEGTHFLFVDADTLINAELLQAMRNAFERGYVAGGALLYWSEPAPFSAHFCMFVWNWISRIQKLPAGSFLFATRESFEQVGGFNEEFFITEELDLGRRLKTAGPLIILRERYHTSSRKLREFTIREHLQMLKKLIINPKDTVRNQKHLDIWYERRDV